MLFVNFALNSVFHKRDARPAVVIGCLVCDPQTIFKILNILFMNIRRSVRFLLTVLHAFKRGLDIDVEVDDKVRPGQSELYIFKIIQPFEKAGQLLIRKLCALMDGVRGRISVRKDKSV